MGANAVDNTNLVNYIDQGLSTFVPAVTYAVAGANVTITDGTTIPAGDTLKKVHLRLIDDFGKEVRDTITVTGAPGQKVLSSATLNTSKGLKICATVITTNGIIADGNAVNIGASGALSNWDSQKN